jgi:predicted NACHT family NTPase
VFRDVVNLEPAEKPGDHERKAEKVPFELLDEAEELLRYFSERLANPRVKWKDEWPKLRHAVVIGYPGDGKSVLARKLVHDLARRSRDQLNQATTPSIQIPLPIFIRLEELGKKQSLEAAMRCQLPVESPGVLLRHLDAILATEHAWVVLDGLDEVNLDHEAEVKKQLERLARGRCRVILTSRPYRYRKADLPFPRLTEFKLAPLTDDQQRAFRETWFQAATDRGRLLAVEQLARANPTVAEMMRNALLLSLICSVSETADLDPNTTRRPQVYEAIVV